MKRIIKKIALLLLVVLIGMQFYRPDKNSSEYNNVSNFETQTQASNEVKTILENKCYDCHSNNTNYPWYAQISPVSLLINDHIVDGKKHLNLSAWSDYTLKKKDHKLDELIEEVEEGHMPEDAYTLIHGKLTSQEKEQLINWAKQARELLKVKTEVTP